MLTQLCQARSASLSANRAGPRRRGDRIAPILLRRTLSAFGTKRTSRSPQLMSAFGVKRTCAGRTSMRPRSNMKLNPADLAKITDFTLSHYNEHAEDFWEGTRDHNVNQNITALLQSIEGEPPYTILDFGCG